MMLRIPVKVLIPAIASLSLLLLLISRSYYYPRSSKLDISRGDDGYIPNQAHFVYVLGDTASDISFEFKHYLSIYSAWYFWRPPTIFLHTNANPDVVARSRDGSSGKWSKLVFDIPGISVNYVTVPTHADNGKEIKAMEHRSDFVRVKAVHDFGGVYIDFDVYPLRDIKILRESGFKAIGGRQHEGQVNSGTFMSVKGGKMIKLWMKGMHQAYTGGWTTHSNEVITKFGERLVSEPGEMLIMEREAFAPGSWTPEDSSMLFAVHADTPSNLEHIKQVNPLPSHEESFSDRWDHPYDFPDWSRDWSKTYLLHAFNPFRFGADIEGFKHITPRYVLERRSNFARAVYPVARHMYNEGLIAIDDSHLGHNEEKKHE